MNSAVDPWVITPRERAKYLEQFRSLRPQNDIVTGAQAKEFFLQSQLPPIVLGQIWTLADTDLDGKMNIDEFSIACKLINLKLRSFELPKVLPQSLLMSAVGGGNVSVGGGYISGAGGNTMITPSETGGFSALENMTTLRSMIEPQQSINNMIPPARPPIPHQPLYSASGIIPQQSSMQGIQPLIPSGNIAGIIPTNNSQSLISGIGMPMSATTAAAAAAIGPPPIIPMTQPLISGNGLGLAYIPSVNSVQAPIPAAAPTQLPMMNAIGIIPNSAPINHGTIDLLGNSITSPIDLIGSTGDGISGNGLSGGIGVNTGLPAPPTPPSGTPSRAMSISDKVPSIDSPSGGGGGIVQLEWAIKSQSKLKYTQLFNTTDRSRSGFLTGAQARNLMVQSKLPQQILAHIWGLSDMDVDGRLGCEEFVLAMYLCELASQGEPVPTKLPPELIPPSFRKGLSRKSSTVGAGSGGIGSRHGSVSSQSGGNIAIIANDTGADPSAGLPSQTSFEDKRKENYDKGQAELERRRKVLLDQQRKEQEERERKEREEAEKREKIRLEQERRQQEELDRQLQRQREIELEKEEKRKREIEQKEAARKEMEKQRQLEWEKQRISEMQLQRQREQEKVLKLKAQNQTYTIELSSLNEKIKELSQKICDTRAGVSNVKTVIDGMRSTRDTQMTDMSQLKSRIKEQNLKLVHLSQEKSKLESKTKHDAAGNNAPDQTAAFSNKQILINQLKGKIETTKQELGTKRDDLNVNNEQLSELKVTLTDLIEACETVYVEYDQNRIQVQELKNNRKNDSMTSAWDTANSTWPTDNSPIQTKSIIGSGITSSAAVTPAAVVAAAHPVDGYDGYVKYRAIYEFSGRNADEISFQPDDIVMVPLEQNAEPGWLAGEINGQTGWFPETYVERCVDDDYNNSTAAPITATNEYNQNIILDNKRQLSGVNEVVEPVINNTINEPTIPIDAQSITAAYNGESEEYIACYPYESTEAGDLVFTAGERIMVIKKEGDWWTGVIGTRTGYFPSNYVEPVSIGLITNTKTDDTGEFYVPPPPTTTTTTITDEMPQENGNSYIGGGPAQVIEEVISPQQHQLSSQKQQINQYAEEAKTQEEADSEVSEINTQPISSDYTQDTYSRPMSTTSTTPGLRKQKGEVGQVIAAYEATSSEQLSLQLGQLIMIRKKTDSGWWEGELQARGRRRQIGWFPAAYVKVLQSGRLSGRSTPVSGGKIQMNEAILDKVIALYPYKAQNDDELSFEKDDIISVMGRDEPEWWRGECQGLSGLFPSNYVGPFVTSGNV